MSRQLWFNRQGEPINVETAERLLGDMAYKRVGLTRITSGSDPAVKFEVSTVWLGLDHGWEGGAPVLFETMVFGGGEDQDQTQWRWNTEAEARAGHTEIATSVAASVADERVEEISERTRDDAPSPDATAGLHVHRWTAWEDAIATYDSPLFPKLGQWKAPVQTRRCTKCKKTDMRELK